MKTVQLNDLEVTLLKHYMREHKDELKGLIEESSCAQDKRSLQGELDRVESIANKLEA